MKDFKRVLSLGLAGTMLAGMMTVGASAADAKDFTDGSEIQNQEAVTTMVALNVIKGKDTGAFDPAATVTRGEMAKMITIMLNGGKEPVLGVSATPSYTDIANHWAQKYIEYCAGENVISGRGDGTFAPDATVTGTEAAKMALVALGYDSTVFNFTGMDWAINVNSRANGPDARLYDGLEGIDPNAALSRDNAAQLLYNALDAKTMATSYDSMTTSGEVTLKYSLSSKTLMETKFNAVKVEGVVTANEAVELGKDSALDAGKTKIEVTNYDKDAPTGKQDAYSGTITVETATGEDELGRSVSVYVKKGSSKAKAVILGDVIVSADNTVVVDNSGDSIFTVADDNNLDLVFAKTDDDEITKAYTNYETAIAVADAVKGDKDKKVDATGVYADNTAGYVVTLVDNDDDGNVEYAFVKEYVLGYVSKKSTKDDGSLTVQADKAYSKDDKADVIGFEDFAREDYVLASLFGGKMYLTKPETVTGELKAYKGTSSLTVDDTKYDISKAPIVTSGTYALDRAEAYADSKNIGNEATFYLDAKGRVVAVGEIEAAASKYAVSWGGATGNKLDNDRIKLTLEDGTTSIYTINSKSDVKISGTDGGKFTGKGITAGTNDNAVGTVVAYSLTSNGEVKLSLPATTKTAEDKSGSKAAEFTKGKTMVTLKDEAKGFATSASTVFFYIEMKNEGKDVDSVKVQTGYANAASVDQATAAAVALNKSDKVAAVSFTGAKASGAEKDHLFLYKTGSTYSDYVEGYVYLAGSDEYEIIKLDDATSYDVDKLYTFTVNSDGYYELDEVTGKDYFKAEAKVDSTSRNTIVIGKAEYVISDKTVVIDNIDNPGTPEAALGGAIVDGQKVMMIVDDDDALMVVITEDADEKGTTPEDHKCSAETLEEVVAVKGKDCQTAGTVKHYKCKTEGCGKTYSDADAKTPITAEDIAKGEVGDHKFDGTVTKTDGDATNHKVACSVENCTETQDEAHTWGTDAQANVCTKCNYDKS